MYHHIEMITLSVYNSCEPLYNGLDTVLHVPAMGARWAARSLSAIYTNMKKWRSTSTETKEKDKFSRLWKFLVKFHKVQETNGCSKDLIQHVSEQCGSYHGFPRRAGASPFLHSCEPVILQVAVYGHRRVDKCDVYSSTTVPTSRTPLTYYVHTPIVWGTRNHERPACPVCVLWDSCNSLSGPGSLHALSLVL